MTLCCSSRSPSTKARLLLTALLLALLGLAAQAASAQSISSTGPLSFGSFTAGAGGTVVVSAAGTRSKTGSVMLINQGSLASAAQFSVTGTASATVALTLPADGTVILYNGANTMVLNSFTSNPSDSSCTSHLCVLAGGTLLFSVGATLTVNGSQQPGSYVGSFDVTVNYN